MPELSSTQMPCGDEVYSEAMHLSGRPSRSIASITVPLSAVPTVAAPVTTFLTVSPELKPRWIVRSMPSSSKKPFSFPATM